MGFSATDIGFFSYVTYATTEEAIQIPETIAFDSCISMSSHKFYTDLKYLESVEAEFVKLRQVKADPKPNVVSAAN